MSQIVIAGGTGFLGAALAAAFEQDGHEVIVLTRQPPNRRLKAGRAVAWTPD